MKKVFYITGTGRSGSTLLDLMMGNDQKGFSVGELTCLMRPWRSHHLIDDGKCKCGEGSCDFWYKIKDGGEKNVYSNIFKERDINFLVDSSKDPLWLKDQIKYSEDKDYIVVPIVIYKEPLELLYSRYKRNNQKGWKKGWKNTYKRLFEILEENLITVKYKELAMQPAEKLKALCETVNIDYFKGKENFWNNQHSHFLFGSGTVRNSDNLVYYEEQFDESLLNYIKQNFNYEDNSTKEILSVLDAYEVSNHSTVPAEIKELRKSLATYNWGYRIFHRIRSTPFYVVNSTVNNIVG